MGVTLSVCMIIRDEAPVLERSLGAAAAFADELIVVDTGSVDDSREIAGRYTGNVYEYVWQDNFAAARNYAYSFATSDYIMWLDADDVILPEDIERIRELKEHIEPQTDVVCMLYDSLKSEENPGDLILRDRWIRRNLHAKWKYAIHEVIPILPEYQVLERPDIHIYHDKKQVNEPGRNLRIFEKLLQQREKLDHYHLSYYCRELATEGRYEEAVSVYEQLVREQAREEEVHYARFYYVEAMNRLKRYRELQKELLHEVDDLHMRVDESMCCFLGNAAMHLQEYEQARGWYVQALQQEINPADYYSHNIADAAFEPYIQLALLEAKTGNLPAGKRYFDKAKALYPKHLKVVVNQAYFDKME